MNFKGFAVALAAGLSMVMSGCTTTPEQFQSNPKGISKGALCRVIMDSYDDNFRMKVAQELAGWGIDYHECAAMVQAQNNAAAAIAIVALAGAAVAVCANNDCSGGGYQRPYRGYEGNCQYPWQRDARGRRCGDRSAYSRPGGY